MTLYVSAHGPDDRADARRRPQGGDRVRLRRAPRRRAARATARTARIALRDRLRVRRLLPRPVRGAPATWASTSRSWPGRSTSATARRSPTTASHDSYDADAVERYWRCCAARDEVLDRLRGAVQRQGEPDPPVLARLRPRARALLRPPRAGRSRGADPVTAEAYSHEVIAFGWWPGDERTHAVPGLLLLHRARAGRACASSRSSRPRREWQDTGNGSLAVLPYDAVRAAPRPGGRCSRSTRARTRPGPPPRAGTSRPSRGRSSGRRGAAGRRRRRRPPARSRRRARRAAGSRPRARAARAPRARSPTGRSRRAPR